MQRILATAATALVVTGAAHSADQLLMRAEFSQRVVGNTVHYQSLNDDVFEYFAADGSIHGESAERGLYSASWRYGGDNGLCFKKDDPLQSGCVGVVLHRGQVSYHRRGGVIEGPYDLLPGNPRKL